ncbi:MAG: ABC transporter permease [Candidatus Aminicenantes bacterium]|nr:ABC transporter permease [Candidatus Aminicenantes bacterium]
MNTTRKPPRLLERFLRSVLPRYVGDTALGDFKEEYERIISLRGTSLANIWYFSQILRSIPAFFVDSIRWGLIMFRNYLKVTLRSIRKQKAFSLINIACLSIGMACVLIILLWVQYETSFDKHHIKAERIFRIACEARAFTPPAKTVVTPPPMSSALVQEFPEIEASTRLSRGGGDKLFSFKDKHFIESFFAVDPSFFKIFTYEFVKGDARTAFNDPYSIVLSEDKANKYFGSLDPLGKILLFDQKTEFTVTGVIRNIPSNSHLQRDIFIPFETWGKLFEQPLEHWKYWSFYTYILLKPEAHTQQLEEKFPAFTERHGISDAHLFLQPLPSIHLHSHFQGEVSPNTHVATLLLFGAIAVLILIIACINYMNLTTARSSSRLKEVGTRKVIGAQRRQIALQFMGESIIMAFISLALSLLFVLLFLPFFNSIAERHLVLSGTSLLQISPGILLLVLFVGILAGSYPALMLSSFKPITVLKGDSRKKAQKSRLRNMLVVVQFSVSLILIISTLLVKSQLDYVKNKEMGFERDQIVVVPLYDEKLRENVGPVLEELRGNPNIIYAAPSLHLPNEIGASTKAVWTGKPEDLEIWIKAGEVGYDFTELYGIKIVEGRSFSRDFPSDAEGAFLINETGKKALGEHFHLRMDLRHWRGQGNIVGVMQDFHLNSLHEEIKPLYFFLNPNRGLQLSVKVRGGNIPETIEFIRSAFKKISPNYPFEYRFFDDIFTMAYLSEQKLEKIFTIFAFIAVFISCMGVFGLSAFMADQKRKEIGIRKVLGASSSKVVYLLSRDLMRFVLLANLIAWPIAYYAMHRWLQNFAYRTNINIGIFLVSSILIILVSFGTLSYQTLKSALANPVDSIRYE